MDITYRYTRHQVPRGTRADLETSDKLYLLKNVSTLRLTYQIRLLAYQAFQRKKKLIIRVPQACKIHKTLREFMNSNERLIKIERAD